MECSGPQCMALGEQIFAQYQEQERDRFLLRYASRREGRCHFCLEPVSMCLVLLRSSTTYPDSTCLKAFVSLLAMSMCDEVT